MRGSVKVQRRMSDLYCTVPRPLGDLKTRGHLSSYSHVCQRRLLWGNEIVSSKEPAMGKIQGKNILLEKNGKVLPGFLCSRNKTGRLLN